MCRGVGSGGRRRRQLRRPGRRLPRRAGPQGVPRDPRRRPVQEHVELPGPADRADAQHRGAAQHRGPAAMRGDGSPAARSRSSTTRRAEARTMKTPRAVQLHRGDAADRLAAAGDREGRQGFVRTGAALAQSPHWTGGGSRSCWRPAAPACSPRATCGPARSSASPRPSARARWRSSSCTST